ncbi:hypothetical protein N7493_008954 [Penicillium malachiteum]|uniref:Zn(2)-C6 fungal-type domain-containing protein n=1 Tax=Penicillium malachiteum TaxID=1324776 RepID=A0AAD6MSX2_9EURO|nr:hypothetical protein N7493_008954 [Penicillium malachiteum]
MQPLVLHPPSLTTAQFGQPRFNSGPERLPLNRPWSTNARGCSPRAPLARQSMSGSPPTAEPSVTSGESDPRGYPVSSPAVTSAEEATVVPVTGPPQLPAPADPLPPSILPRYGEQHQHQHQHQHQPQQQQQQQQQHQQHQQHHHHHHQHAPLYAESQRIPAGPSSYPISSLESALPGPASRSLAQKSTRRTKAHVASACVNCKKKHLGCDPARPCRRCVLAGKASSCVDVTHKKRGRPPLKAEDSTLRSYAAHPDHPAAPTDSQSAIPSSSHRSSLHRPTSSRELRPMTDLQAMGSPGSTAAMRAPRVQPQQRWSASSVFPLTRPMDPAVAMPNPAARRPFSSSGPPSYPPPAPPGAYVPMTSGFNPAIKAGPMPPGMDRRFAPYAGPALPPPTSPPQHHHPPGVQYMPYGESPSGPMHHPMVDPRLAPGPPREPYIESPVRLPPIHQATASPGPPVPPVGPPPPNVPHHAHRLSDPYPTTWTMAREDPLRDPRVQRPVGSVFSHPHHHHQRSSSSTTASLDPIPRHLGPIDLPSPVQLAHSPPVARSVPSAPETKSPPQPPQPQTEPEPRPVKRRKMALDDMVNG